MEKRQFYKMVFALVLPIALQNLINVGVTAADVIMLGMVGETALSAGSLANQVSFILNLLMFGMSSGAAVLTAQYWGKKDTATIEKVLGISMRLAIVAGLVFMAAALLIPRQLMLIFTQEEEIIAAGIPYLRIVAFSYLLMAVNMTYLNLMRSVERVLIGMITYAVSLGVNVVLNAIFIFGLFGCPAMGTAGAALGTTLARVTEFIIILIYNNKFNDILNIRGRALQKAGLHSLVANPCTVSPRPSRVKDGLGRRWPDQARPGSSTYTPSPRPCRPSPRCRLPPWISTMRLTMGSPRPLPTFWPALSLR